VNSTDRRRLAESLGLRDSTRWRDLVGPMLWPFDSEVQLKRARHCRPPLVLPASRTTHENKRVYFTYIVKTCLTLENPHCRRPIHASPHRGAALLGEPAGPAGWNYVQKRGVRARVHNRVIPARWVKRAPRGPETRLRLNDRILSSPRCGAAAEPSRAGLRRGVCDRQSAKAIIYQDEKSLFSISPPVVAVHGGSAGLASGSSRALRALRPTIPWSWCIASARDNPGAAHRAVRRAPAACLHALLRTAFRERYLALLRGNGARAKRIDVPLRTDTRVGGYARCVRVLSGKPSVSDSSPGSFFGRR